MCTVFTRGSNTIVTGRATSNDTSMIQLSHHRKVFCSVTRATIIVAADMPRMFAGGVYTIVTGSTGLYNIAVIKPSTTQGKNLPGE